MDFIINPSWFYWIGIVDDVEGIAVGILVLSLMVFVVSLLIMIACFDNFDNIYQLKTAIIVSACVACLSALAVIFIPSKDTMIEMMVAKLVTYDNVALTADGIKSVTDYIVEAIATIGG